MSSQSRNNTQLGIDPDIWGNVGVFPTPPEVVESFTKFTLQAINGKTKKHHVLDLFAGDGRLGDSFRQQLNEKGMKSLTFLEIRENAISEKTLNGFAKLVVENGFTYAPKSQYDIIVSNPPYLSLNSKQAEALGFSWKNVQTNAKNLYGLGISKAIELCKPDGIVAVIAPFGYLRGVNSALFREKIEELCSEVLIRASSNRNLFDDANQDIAFQVFKKRKKNDQGKSKWKFAYDNAVNYATIHVSLPLSKRNAEKYVRVGPIVWNRKKAFLTKKSPRSVAVIYGGNITHNGKLDFEVNRYRDRQYIKRKGTIPTDIISAPFIAIRRTLRGKPGNWIVDSALILENDRLCTGENHTIIVELPELSKVPLQTIQHELIDSIRDHYYLSGSPNLSTIIVGKLFSKIINRFLEA